jgi:Protein of unknown function (DUF3500)
MFEKQDERCPECDALSPTDAGLSRRVFMKAVGGTAVTLAGLQAVPRAASMAFAKPDTPAQPAAPKPAEALVRELYSGLSDAQKRDAVYAWNHGATATQPATRLRFYNNAAMGAGKQVGDIYTPAQQQLVERILRSIASDDNGMRQLTRGGTYDASQSLQRCGAYIFGDPTGNQQFCWLFTGHHLTVRCDGNSEPNAAFGGPMYYGHSPDGYSERNIFNYQTRAVRGLFDALSGAQQTRALLNGSPGELLPSVQFRNQGYPGLPVSDMTADQRALVQTVMRTVLSPYRREDADEAMDLIRRNGGLERIHFAFYRDPDATDAHPWHFWRLEGPGFVWNYRVLPHVHTYVNIALRAAPAAPAST